VHRAGEADAVYEYVGQDPLASPDLTFDSTGNQGQDYTNIDKWRQVTALQQDYANHDAWKLVNVNRAPLEVEAYTEDSSIEAGGPLSIDAKGEQAVDALVFAGSVALAVGLILGIAVGVSGAGAGSDNNITTDIAAFIDGDRGGEISATG